jgi:ribosomal protein S18 acetylase RimI-like enzyme
MVDVYVRPARVGDRPRIAGLLSEPPAAQWVAIAGSVAAARRATRLLVEADVSIQLASTVVVERDVAIVGVMDAAAHWREPDLTPALLIRLVPRIVSVAGPLSLWRLLRARPVLARVSFEIDPRSFYIAEVTVDAALRNRGIGGALLDDAERRARAAGCPGITLTTDVTNPARRLYERHGFVITGEKRDGEYERYSMSPGRVLMTKALA